MALWRTIDDLEAVFKLNAKLAATFDEAEAARLCRMVDEVVRGMPTGETSFVLGGGDGGSADLRQTLMDQLSHKYCDSTQAVRLFNSRGTFLFPHQSVTD